MYFTLAILGWAFWTAFMFRREKQKHDRQKKKFSFRQYTRETYEDWILNLIGAISLMAFGYYGLHIDLTGLINIDSETPQALYCFGAGFIIEAFIKVYDKWDSLTNKD